MKKIIIVLLVVFVSMPVIAQVSTPGFLTVDSRIFEKDDFQISFESGAHYLYGETQEIVYSSHDGERYELSRLEWGEEALMVGGTLSFGFLDMFSINGSIWTSVSDIPGIMEDFDWMGHISPYNQTGHDASEWTHYSKSNIKMDLNTYDFNLMFSPRTENGVMPSIMLGYRQENWSWTDEILYLNYSTGGSDGFRDYYYEFPEGTSAINYEVTLKAMYFGAGIGFVSDKFLINGYAMLTPWTSVKDIDEHLLRDMVFVDEFKNTFYTEFGIEVSLEFLKNCYLSLNASYTHATDSRGEMTIYEEGDEIGHYSNCSGYKQSTLRTGAAIGFAY